MATQYASYPGSQYNGGLPPNSGYQNSLPSPYAAYTTNQQSNNTMTGFAFRKRIERVDWRRIASIDVDSITRNLEFNTLQDNIMNITFCNIESEVDIRTIDPNFIKLFKLAQLTIEYLLHSQDYLTGNMSAFDQKVRKVLEDHDATRQSLDKTKAELGDVKKESHKRKKMLIAQQQIIQAGSNAFNKCPYCDKAFVNPTFLQSHLARRHSEVAGSIYPNESLVRSSPAISQPQHIPPAHTANPNFKPQENELVAKDLSDIKERLRLTESQLVDERNARNSMIQKERHQQSKRENDLTKDMENWKQDQLDLHRHEMDGMRDMFMRELKEMGEKYSRAEEALYNVKKRKQSNLGELTDEVQEDRILLRKQREEVALLKEQLQDQVANVEDIMQQKIVEQDHKWKHKLDEAEIKNQKLLEQLEYTLEQKSAELFEERKSHEHLQAQLEQTKDEVNFYTKKTKGSSVKIQKRGTDIQEIPRKDNKDRRNANSYPATKVTHSMQPESDEDQETVENTLTNSMRTATGTFTGTSTGGSGTLGTFQYGTGSLSLSGTRSVRLIDEVKRNPNVLHMMKNELRENLEAELERRGISKVSQGINTATLSDKMALLKNERQHTAKKHKNFYDIRQQYLNELEILAKDKLKAEKQARGEKSVHKQSPIPSRHSAPGSVSRTLPVNREESAPWREKSAQPSRPTRTDVPRSVGQAMPRLSSPQPRVPTSHAAPPKPVPRPRSTSPTGKGMLGTMSTGTYSSTGKTATSFGAMTSSSQWDASDDEESDAPIKQQLADDDDDEEGDSWDDVTEMDDIVPDPTNPTRAPTRSIPSPKPKGPNVLNLSRSLEGQFADRHVKRPAGAVDLIKPAVDDDEDDTFSLVSSDEESSTNTKPKPSVRKPNLASRASTDGATDQSNTYNTDMWGSGSRALSTAQAPGTHANNTSAKNTTMSSSDWDSDGDINVDDLS